MSEKVKDTETKEKKNKKKDDIIVELEAEVADLTDKCARAQAEVINFKKRKEDETALRLKYCNEDILINIVNICDNFERAIMMDEVNLSEEMKKFLSGFKMIYVNLIEVLKANEVVEIECLNREFDPKVMEAIIVEHTDDKNPHEVLEVLQKGYMYKDKILRPAMVKIND